MMVSDVELLRLVIETGCSSVPLLSLYHYFVSVMCNKHNVMLFSCLFRLS